MSKRAKHSSPEASICSIQVAATLVAIVVGFFGVATFVEGLPSGYPASGKPEFLGMGALIVAVAGVLQIVGSIYEMLRVDYERKCRLDGNVVPPAPHDYAKEAADCLGHD